jgi:hypothetical protein
MNCRANVVLPAPFGPPITIAVGLVISKTSGRLRPQGICSTEASASDAGTPLQPSGGRHARCDRNEQRVRLPPGGHLAQRSTTALLRRRTRRAFAITGSALLGSPSAARFLLHPQLSIGTNETNRTSRQRPLDGPFHINVAPLSSGRTNKRRGQQPATRTWSGPTGAATT